MKIWLDSCTGKHMRYDIAIVERLRNNGHECIITTRQHPDTVSIAKHLNETVKIIGTYRGKSRISKLEASTSRIRKLTNFAIDKEILDRKPDVAISHGSVEQCRVAFGLGIPIVCTWDSPHATAVEALTLPLCKYIVACESLRPYLTKKYAEKELRFFNGVDEVAWMYQASKVVVSSKFYPHIVYRAWETVASYSDRLVEEQQIIAELNKVGDGDVTVLERAPKKFVDTLTVVKHADLVVGHGGTICREAALQRTPCLVIDTGMVTHSVNVFLAERRFPIFFYMYKRGAKGLLKHAKSIIATSGSFEEDKLLKLENPINVLEKIMEEI